MSMYYCECKRLGGIVMYERMLLLKESGVLLIMVTISSVI